VSEQAEVIVVGGGQAGLTAGYYLTQAKIPVRDPPRRLARRRRVDENGGTL
jgi:cation diffusion facilitator CzcD-associated flavoprotein CzcO